MSKLEPEELVFLEDDARDVKKYHDKLTEVLQDFEAAVQHTESRIAHIDISRVALSDQEVMNNISKELDLLKADALQVVEQWRARIILMSMGLDGILRQDEKKKSLYQPMIEDVD